MDDDAAALPVLRLVDGEDFVDRLAAATIGETFKPVRGLPAQAGSAQRVPGERSGARLLLVARRRGSAGRASRAFPDLGATAHRQPAPPRRPRPSPTPCSPSSGSTATSFSGTVVPTHRAPEFEPSAARAEIEASAPFLAELSDGRRAVAIRQDRALRARRAVRAPSLARRRCRISRRIDRRVR